MIYQAKTFKFVSYKVDYNKKRIFFFYQIEFVDHKKIDFKEEIIFSKKTNFKNVPKEFLKNILRDLHLILGINYYKTYCPSKIVLKEDLTKEQADFWNKVYQKGLGEFFYRNKIDFKKLINFPYNKNKKDFSSIELKTKEKSLVGIGGGKDSIVVMELLKENNENFSGFVVEPQRTLDVVENVVKGAGVEFLKIRRVLDYKLFENLPESYKGHIPVSAVYAFLGLLCASLFEFKYVIVGNEQSSNFGNVKYKGMEINHQWSKTFEFEKLFSNYIKKFLTPSITYFSLLRPFYEIRIVKMFSQYKKYFSYFSSCNRNFKINKKNKNNFLWCGECPKCVFVFSLLSPFISKKNLLKMFKKNLFNDEKLISLFRDILGFGKLKPFDCVGTPEEMQASLYLSRHKFKDDFIVKTFLPKIKNGENLIKKVFSTTPSYLIPEKFRFYGIKNILILGYGKEGTATEKYIKKNFSKIQIGIADKKANDNYLEKQKDYDLIIKTPGIPKKKVNSYYTTATNIFFSNNKNKIIGITGSKGKSTTASLIYEVLKEGGFKVSLLGNIGKPMLEALNKKQDKEDIFVVELSSYQLDDIRFSPHIAVVTNLFPEHMDYHEKKENYYQAKKNIVNFQNVNDFFVYNKKDLKLSSWAKETKAKKISFNDKALKQKEIKTNLAGKHNLENIEAAVSVGKIFKIPFFKIKKAINNFKGLSHRLEYFGEFKKIKFYDDAISTAPESTIAAIKAIPNIKTIFLGGTDRGYDFSLLEKEIRSKKIKNVVLFPDSGKRILKSKKGLNILETKSMREAVLFAYKNTPEGSVCLLSTASPSYSVWKNFEEKGDLFKKLVKELSF